MSPAGIVFFVLGAPSAIALATYFYLLLLRGGHRGEAAEEAGWVFFYSLGWAILVALIYGSFRVLPGALL